MKFFFLKNGASTDSGKEYKYDMESLCTMYIYTVILYSLLLKSRHFLFAVSFALVSVSAKIIGFSCVDLKLDFLHGKVGSTQKKVLKV